MKPNMTSAEVNHLIERAFVAWESLPNVEREISTWDLTDLIVFIEEWPREEERLQRLAEYSRAGMLDDAQQVKYTRLLDVVARNRPIASRLTR